LTSGVGSADGASAMTQDLRKWIDDVLANDRVLIFTQGSLRFQMCGFSRAAVQTLRAPAATEIAAYNVLENPELREGIKVYSNWPTIPQVYVDGKFIGGSDILRELHERGELARLIRG